jgi:predicted AlkP superfamily phosphohydrolase/phosphomutase
MIFYIGPGAGFVFGGTFVAVLAAIFSGFLSLFLWPIRLIRRTLSGVKAYKEAKVRRIVYLGLDGLDPKLAERFMGEGKMPNLKKLSEKGHYSRLRTTFPCLSPVAWSCFATGGNPAKHNIFGFLSRNPKTYTPELSSSKVRPPARSIKIFGKEIPLGGPDVEMRRKSVPFWKLLGDHEIHSTILRIPITFPPEKFNGHMLSAMCTPDLRGTQGSFSFYSTKFDEPDESNGLRLPLRRDGDTLRGEFWGPPDPEHDDRNLTTPFSITKATGKDVKPGSYDILIDGQKHRLQAGKYSPWLPVRFRGMLGATAKGIARLLITGTEPDFQLYVTPINIDPSSPALPISHPANYAVYLSKLMGSYATLGLAEDTWALNERVIDEQAFLDQAWLNHEEREEMFFNALEKTPRGVVACVFDASDRIQHMFYRTMLPDHPANKDRDIESYKHVLGDMYAKMDDLVGRTLKHVGDNDLFFVLSDHGFESFYRGVNLNSWLCDNGYLVLKEGAKRGGDFFKGVDWSKTKAYSVGLGGIYLNRKGREAKGIVEKGKETEALKAELKSKLDGLVDDERGEVAIKKVAISSKLYRGPYLGAGPDLLVGYNKGYRASWAAVTGGVTDTIFEDNDKAWGGDHCIDPELVPGVLYCNRPLDREDPGLEDMAPTALTMFGLPIPKHMDGKPLLQ